MVLFFPRLIEDQEPQLTSLIGKQKCILDESPVFLHLFVNLNVYFSSCLVLLLWAELNGVFAKKAEIKHGLW